MKFKKGDEVRIKTVMEIEAMYGEGYNMPYSLTSEMSRLCGTVQTVQNVFEDADRKHVNQRVVIHGSNYPDTVLESTKPIVKQLEL